MDTTISDPPDTEEPRDQTLGNAEFPVSLATLSVDGTNPEVGDNVEVRVQAKVTRVVNDMAYVKPETVNGEPLPAEPIAPNPAKDERSRLLDLSEQSGAIGSY